ncbi:MAG UNVERIFIED_CONTAM: hypothetical protein LVR18_16915 [Planctomycetaceae bacterium]
MRSLFWTSIRPTGAITISAGGTITATSVRSTNSAEANDITLTATVGDILVGLVTAGTTRADVLLNAVAGGIEESGTADTDADIVGEAIEFIASTGVGSSAQLEVDGVQLAAVTTTGNISILDTTNGLDISSVDVNGDGSQTEGVSIAAVSGNFNITIRTNSPLTINSDVINNSGGNIILAAEGNLVTDDLSINANVTATGGNGSISLFAGDSISLAATVTVSATGTGNILLSGSTDYNAGTPQNGFNAPAGADGRISMTSGALIQSANGSITLQADGDILLSRVESTGGATITITANYDGINTGLAADGSGAISDNLTGDNANITTSGLAVLDAATGIGTSTDDINTDIGQLNASVNSIGSLYLTDVNAITLTDVDTFNGSITITAGGQITSTDVESLTDAEANDIILRTTAGSILAGRISAGSTGDVWLNSAAAVEESGNDAAADIVAETLEINAATGIGAAGELEINAFNLGTATTAGAIVLLDTTDGLTISSVNVDGTGTATSGVTITAGATSDLLRIRTRSQLTVNNTVSNTGGGSIILASEGNLVTDDLAINANVTTTGGDGNISLYAGDSISLAATVTVSAAGNGNILLSGSTDYNAGTPQNGFNAPAGADGRISMTSGALIQSVNGSITLQADGDILLSSVQSTGGGTITITANYDGIDAGLAADNSGAILDNLAAETANITTSGLVVLDAASGIGTSTDDINTDIGQLNASVNSIGSLYLTDANAITLTDVDTFNGSITITAGGQITATDVESLTDAEANDIILRTTAGSILVGRISAGSTGDVWMNSAAAVEESGNDAAADIVAETLEINAATGIGAADELEINAFNLGATTTAGGNRPAGYRRGAHDFVRERGRDRNSDQRCHNQCRCRQRSAANSNSQPADRE